MSAYLPFLFVPSVALSIDTRGRNIAQLTWCCAQYINKQNWLTKELFCLNRIQLFWILFFSTHQQRLIQTTSYLPRMSFPIRKIQAAKPKNAAVERSFYSVINPRFSGRRSVRKFCKKELDHNATTLQRHLNKCQQY